MKKITAICSILIGLTVIISACSGEKIIKLNELKKGDILGGMVISEIDEYQNITFDVDTILQGGLFYNAPSRQVGINSLTFNEKIQVEDKIIDMSKETITRFTKNPVEINQYLTTELANSNPVIKVRIKNYKLQISKDNVGMFAEIIEVVEIAGKNPEDL